MNKKMEVFQVKGNERFLCRNSFCSTKTFQLEYVYKAKYSWVTNVIIDRVNKPYLESLTQRELKELHPKMVTIEEAEIDEMWSFVGKKEDQCWLWHAIDHRTGKLLAYVFGRRKDEVYKPLKPFEIKRLYTDAWATYTYHPQKNEKHIVGKKNTQRIESKHLTFRTHVKRLARETICFSKSFLMHTIAFGLFINRCEFGYV